MEVVLDGNSLSIEQVAAVARQGANVTISNPARKQAQRSRELLEKLVAEGVAIYGVTTGIGELARVRISPQQMPSSVGGSSTVTRRAPATGSPTTRSGRRCSCGRTCWPKAAPACALA